ncbi:hypothetical protein Tco_1188810 [Tanacetum coccineum]
MDSLNKTATDRVNLLKPLNGVTKTLKVVQDVVMDDPVLNKKVIKATKAYTKNSSALTELLSLADTEQPPSHTEGEHVAMEDHTKKHESNKAEEEPTRAVPISIVTPLTDPILEIHLTEEKIQAHMDKEEHIKKAIKEAKVFEMTKTEVIKVVREEAEKIGLNPKKIISAKAGEKLKPEPITNVKIHLNSKPAVLKVYKNNDKKNFDVHNPFKFGDFGITELDEFCLIIEKKKNSIGRKRKHMELEPEIKVHGLEYNRSLPKGVPFVNNMVIEEPEYRIFFTDVYEIKPDQRG